VAQSGDSPAGAVPHLPVLPKGLAEQPVGVGVFPPAVGMDFQEHRGPPYAWLRHLRILPLLFGWITQISLAYVATFETQSDP